MITISFHVKVRVDVAKGNWESPETITRQLAEEIQSNLESLGWEGDLQEVQADVVMIGREQS